MSFVGLGWLDRLHLYGYAMGNPVRFADPTGLACGSGLSELLPDSVGDLYDFEEACRQHDACYDTYGRSKEECDKEFLDNMADSCVGDAACDTAAGIYYQGANWLGGGAYSDAQQAARCKAEQAKTQRELAGKYSPGTYY